MKRLVMSAVILAMLAGCGGSSSEQKPKLTEHQRDSVLATEKAIPGSGAVGGALNAAAKEQQHAADMDSLTR